jgi:hypothetical protein
MHWYQSLKAEQQLAFWNNIILLATLIVLSLTLLLAHDQADYIQSKLNK